MNVNAFIARLTRPDFARWLTLPIWQLRAALEGPPVTGPAMECRLWVASEWITQCADVLFQDMTSGEELDEGAARFLRAGPLCEDAAPPSAERWRFWKKRFEGLAADAESLGVDVKGPVVARIADALERMDTVTA